jgi:tRNA/rRNA methyltransferase
MTQAFFAYMLHCGDASYYVGHTDDLAKRLAEHQSGNGSQHTRSRLPVKLVWHQTFGTREEAKAAETRVKGWNRAKKDALIAGRFDIVSTLARRGAEGRALRDALLRKAPQGRGSSE